MRILNLLKKIKENKIKNKLQATDYFLIVCNLFLILVEDCDLV